MNTDINALLADLETLASSSKDDFERKFWANYVNYLNQYNAILSALHDKRLYEDISPIDPVPKRKTSPMGFSFAEQAKLREITNAAQSLLRKLRLQFPESRVDTLSSQMTISREGVFFAGQYFDALQKVTEILEQADSQIDVIDGYVDSGVLNLLTRKKSSVTVNILTKSVDPALKQAADAFNKQYHKLAIRTSNAFHDRFIIIDNKEFYHFGASIKDVGKRGFMFSRIEEEDVIKTIQKKFTEEWSRASAPEPLQRERPSPPRIHFEITQVETAFTQLAAILNKFVNHWKRYERLAEDKRWIPSEMGDMIQTAGKYSEELLNLLAQYDSVIEAGILQQARLVFDLMKEFSLSQIPSVFDARPEYEKIEEKGKEAYDKTIALLNYLKQTRIS